jgi:ethanolamine utilization protein EutP (predicted NTPase)
MIETKQEAVHIEKPSRKKPIFPVNEPLRNYLTHYGREVSLPATYEDLRRFTYTVPIKGKDGKDSSWERVSYDMREWDFLRENLVKNYAILKTKGDMEYVNHLDVAAIDFCFFGNSQPFRIRIINKYNANFDHYYIKQADASRIYGLELEHLLSPNRITYFTNHNTLVEEHIPGIPGDIFVSDYLNNPTTNQIRLAKEFVKFNERCFTHLLGDMRSYNFVVSITPDVLNYQYRFRSIDFDQQSYEGRKNLYLPQFFKENKPYVDIVSKHLNRESIAQYQAEERTSMAFRLSAAKYRVKELLDIMSKEDISKKEKIDQLKEELAEHHHEPAFLKATTMGQVVRMQLKQTLRKSLSFIPKNRARVAD